MPSGPIARGERVGLLDVLRGFALFGILVVNMAAFKSPVFGDAVVDTGSLDDVASWLIAFGFQTKFYVIFSFLFGYGLSVQMNRAAAKGVPFVPRFLRRLLGLLTIGLAHAVLLFASDILVAYALLGVVLLLVRNARDGVLLGTAAGLVAATALALCLGGAVLASSGPGADDGPAAEAEAVQARAEAERATEAYRGSPAEVIGERVGEYPGTLAFVLFLQGPTALAMFLVGLWTGRRRLFERVDDHLSLLRRTVGVGLAFGVSGALAWATVRVVNGFDLNATFLFGSAVDFATAPFLSAAYVAAIALLYRNPTWRRRLLSPLAPVGRMALSNYLLQSLTGALVFTGYGLGLYGRVGAALGLALSLAIFAAQVPLSARWLGRFRFGPAEWALRSFTYARAQPLRVSTEDRGRTPPTR